MKHQQKIKPQACSLFAAVLFAVALLPEAALAQPPFKLNTSIKAPFSTQAQDGFLDLLTKELFSRLNLPMEIVRLPAERAMSHVNRKHEARVQEMAHTLKTIKADGTYDRIAATTLGKNH